MRSLFVFALFVVSCTNAPVARGCVVSSSSCLDYVAGLSEAEAQQRCAEAGGVFQNAWCSSAGRVARCTVTNTETGITVRTSTYTGTASLALSFCPPQMADPTYTYVFETN